MTSLDNAPATFLAGQNLATRVLAQRSLPWVKLFGLFCARDLASSFHAVRLLGQLPQVEGPLVLFANHPSWWDSLLYGWLATTVFANRRCFAPMDAPNLQRYSLLMRFGAFPTFPGSLSGGSAFLAVAERVLADTDGLLGVAIEGRYRDVRSRPLRPMPGLALLARRIPTATFVPVALEYVFWSERRPNVLLSFGEPISARTLSAMPASAATARVADALEATMSRLAEASQSRDPQRFTTLLKGRDGMTFLFDLWRRAKALASGRRFDAAHRCER